MKEYQFQRLPAASQYGLIVSNSKTGSKDGKGTGDHDQPFAGFRAYQFSTHQLARLLLLRGDLREASLGRANMPADALTGSDTTCLLSQRRQTFLTNF